MIVLLIIDDDKRLSPVTMVTYDCLATVGQCVGFVSGHEGQQKAHLLDNKE